MKENGWIPEHVTVQTWFSFLLQHGARPYQGCKFDKDINGLVLMSERSAFGISESDTARYYFTKSRKIYSDKLPNFVVQCNGLSNGAVVDRLTRIYADIFIDEVQDLSGYDLEVLRLLFASRSNVLMVCDPRQGTYSTGNSAKHRKFQKAGIVHFFGDSSLGVEIDDVSLEKNYRCVPEICDFSNRLYPDYRQATSENRDRTGHDGVFLVRSTDVNNYLSMYPETMQLRDSVRDERVSNKYPVMNFGLSKGMEFPRVLIYPTKPFVQWLNDNQIDLAPTSRAKFYVAATRASSSVGIVADGINRNYWPDSNISITLGQT